MTIVPDMLLLYVENVDRSADFYRKLFAQEPVEASKSFAMFALKGLRLGLWLRSEVKPTTSTTGGGAEIAIAVGSTDKVVELAQDWRAKSVVIAQEPTDMDFGHTFVALDPDAHRIRVFSPALRG